MVCGCLYFRPKSKVLSIALKSLLIIKELIISEPLRFNRLRTLLLRKYLKSVRPELKVTLGREVIIEPSV
jgi:hypothetical protein